ncbi:uncharacterized protein I303_100810 [Kwoniella dejecticola CBS 10117]|uniref:BTB domain-containing protein n=1 Tax=Kwoniella dejecticola CBS 10117 TaxID=1296121 RepID=A0A1A6AFY9_9TREE|nr:uncharacterized protein I303_00812 [Kwoniella dejecticola CBS 10117]OBR88992.1 hypothetical protein I303_00812 [Kwoniella dejecticola CBS 10117]
MSNPGKGAGTTPAGQKDKIHAFHRYGDLQLRSTDKVIFKVILERMADISAVFRNMMEVVDPMLITFGMKRKAAPEADVIDTDLSSAELEIFLDLVNVPNPVMPSVAFPRALRLHEFCDKFEVYDKIKGIVKTELLSNGAQGYQWALLIWAAKRDDLVMARDVLSIMTPAAFLAPNFPKPTQTPIRCTFWSAMSELPLSWQLELCRLSLTAPLDSQLDAWVGGPKSMKVTLDWVGLSTRFRPQKWGREFSSEIYVDCEGCRVDLRFLLEHLLAAAT